MKPFYEIDGKYLLPSGCDFSKFAINVSLNSCHLYKYYHFMLKVHNFLDALHLDTVNKPMLGICGFTALVDLGRFFSFLIYT
jgi:hypothetical protein